MLGVSNLPTSQPVAIVQFSCASGSILPGLSDVLLTNLFVPPSPSVGPSHWSSVIYLSTLPIWQEPS
ncbi:unnamed protein product [Protopolystoma xenopodis]|uniref:Uncharacterized protein n=1 Tax=Protopolystoma xenopodis TaxID=117903 RepID=A0A448WWG8_9PLAT|nr:unnamed protein product [Protopolystoma xenopodis]